MCLKNREEISIPEQPAFKLFRKYSDGALWSPMVYMDTKRFSLNERIRVFPENRTFFAFKEKDKIESFVRNNLSNEEQDQFVVLPVTLYNVVAQGIWVGRTYDPQCMDYRIPSFEAKELIIHA